MMVLQHSCKKWKWWIQLTAIYHGGPNHARSLKLKRRRNNAESVYQDAARRARLCRRRGCV
jgi:hypothetical protein